MPQPRLVHWLFCVCYTAFERSCGIILCLEAAGQFPNVSSDRGLQDAYPYLLLRVPPLTEARLGAAFCASGIYTMDFAI